jgi:hypothetical protein
LGSPRVFFFETLLAEDLGHVFARLPHNSETLNLMNSQMAQTDNIHQSSGHFGVARLSCNLCWSLSLGKSQTLNPTLSPSMPLRSLWWSSLSAPGSLLGPKRNPQLHFGLRKGPQAPFSAPFWSHWSHSGGVPRLRFRLNEGGGLTPFWVPPVGLF